MPLILALLLAAFGALWLEHREPRESNKEPAAEVTKLPAPPPLLGKDEWQTRCQERFDQAKRRLGFVMGEDELAQLMQPSGFNPQSNGGVGFMLGHGQYIASVSARRPGTHPDYDWLLDVDEDTGMHVMIKRVHGHVATLHVDGNVGNERFHRFSALLRPVLDECLSMDGPRAESPNFPNFRAGEE